MQVRAHDVVDVVHGSRSRPGCAPRCRRLHVPEGPGRPRLVVADAAIDQDGVVRRPDHVGLDAEAAACRSPGRAPPGSSQAAVLLQHLRRQAGEEFQRVEERVAPPRSPGGSSGRRAGSSWPWLVSSARAVPGPPRRDVSAAGGRLASPRCLCTTAAWRRIQWVETTPMHHAPPMLATLVVALALALASARRAGAAPAAAVRLPGRRRDAQPAYAGLRGGAPHFTEHPGGGRAWRCCCSASGCISGLRDLLAVWRVALPGAVAAGGGRHGARRGCWALGFGLGWGAALVFGLALAIASTAVATRMLEERGAARRRRPGGSRSAGWWCRTCWWCSRWCWCRPPPARGTEGLARRC